MAAGGRDALRTQSRGGALEFAGDGAQYGRVLAEQPEGELSRCPPRRP
ncbi:hypothetical protein [Streptomyces sp. WAC 01325]|nr:hypothetical protein [Streptomyces sp. WAC 01325]